MADFFFNPKVKFTIHALRPSKIAIKIGMENGVDLVHIHFEVAVVLYTELSPAPHSQILERLASSMVASNMKDLNYFSFEII